MTNTSRSQKEGNRQLIDTITDIFFVPTELTKQNLLKEGKDETKIVVTGNTVIDAVHYTKNSTVKHPVLDLMDSRPEQKWILLTTHRRENYGQPMQNIFEAILEIVKANQEVEVLLPVHLSPIVQKAAKKILSNNESIHLIEPLEVDVFHQILNKAYLVMTDSGGLQEEAPALDKPVLVLRDITERPEGQVVGTLKVIGTDKKNIIKEAVNLIDNEAQYDKMSKAVNPYGNGFASEKIIKVLNNYFKGNM